MGGSERHRQQPSAVGLADEQDASRLASSVRYDDVSIPQQLVDLVADDAMPGHLPLVVLIEDQLRYDAPGHAPIL
jgi:hypothetical protein